MIEFREIGIKCVFEPRWRPYYSDKLYYFLVAEVLGILSDRKIYLDTFEEDSKSRTITFRDEAGESYELYHSWKRDGTSSKPETYWIQRSLGRFAIWDRLGNDDITKDHGPWAYAEDLYSYMKEVEE